VKKKIKRKYLNFPAISYVSFLLASMMLFCLTVLLYKAFSDLVQNINVGQFFSLFSRLQKKL
jgi:hypothetical protein